MTRSWRKQKATKSQSKFCKIQARYELYFTLNVLSKIIFMIFCLFYSLLHAIVPKFPIIFVHDGYKVSGQPVAITCEWRFVDQSDCKK